MKKKARYKDAKDKRPTGGFVTLSHIVVCSAQWARLSPFAVKLLLELLGQYRGNNNGDLTTAWTVLRPRGWKSKQSLYKAIDELEAGAWIQRTRQGGRHTATLWAITIFALDDDNPRVKAKMDIVAGDFRRGAWAQQRIDPPAALINGVSCAPPVVPMKSELVRPSYQSTALEASIGPPVVPVEALSALPLARPSYSSIDLPSPGDVLVDPPSACVAKAERAAVTRPKLGPGFDRGLFRPQRAAASGARTRTGSRSPALAASA
jgi:hypothetical protein